MPREVLNQRLMRPPVNRAAYSDRMAWIMACCSQWAYEPGGQKLSRKLETFGLRLAGKFYCDRKQNFAYLAAHESYAVLAFKGTVPGQVRTVETDVDVKLVRSRYGDLHRGFFTAYRKLARQIEPVLEEVRRPVYIAGHSLGGALAMLAAAFLKDQDRLAACYTYGCPRVGDDDFAERLFKVPVYRCVHRADLVPSVPLLAMGYRAYGDIRFLKGDGKVCGGSEAVLHRLLAMLNPFNIPKWIPDHGIQNYINLLRDFASDRN